MQKLRRYIHPSITIRSMLVGLCAGSILLAAFGIYELTISLEETQQQALISSPNTQVLAAHDESIPLGILPQPSDEKLAHMQKEALEGNQSWRLDPVLVAIIQGPQLGFNLSQTTPTLIQDSSNSSLSVVSVKIIQAQGEYLLTLHQPYIQGAGGIWVPLNIAFSPRYN